MKFIKSLSEEEIVSLELLCKTSPTFRLRQRAHAIMLSHKKFSMNSLATIFDVDRDTVSAWLKSWETEGLQGLCDKPKTGRPSILTAEEQNLQSGRGKMERERDFSLLYSSLLARIKSDRNSLASC